MSSHSSSPKDSSNGSAPGYIKGVEKLIDSDEQEKLITKLYTMQKIIPILKKMHPFTPNSEKLSLFLKDSNFRNKLTEKLKQKGVFNLLPIVIVSIYSTRHRSSFIEEFDAKDIIQAFKNFGNVMHVYCQKKVAYIEYSDYISAYMAIQTLNDFPLAGQLLRISARWCNNLEEVQIIQNCFYLQQQQNNNELFMPNVARQNIQKIQKYMCRYDIYLDQFQQFKTAQKIIGPKGSYMKKIIDKCVNISGADTSAIQNQLKLRLRGKGSGFKQGQNQSDEILNLCISAKQQKVYNKACQQVEQLLQKIVQDYKIYAFKISKKPIEGVAYRKYSLDKQHSRQSKNKRFQQFQNEFQFLMSSSVRNLREKDILQMIQLRDNLRKQGKFQEADDVRNQLKRKGVCLIDHKTAKGKFRKTTWKYIDE